MDDTTPSTEAVNDKKTSRQIERGFRFWAIIVGLGITTILAALEHTVVTTSAPVILRDLRLRENFVWITNAFFICRFVALMKYRLFHVSQAKGLS